MKNGKSKMKNSANNPSRRRTGASLRHWSVRGFWAALILHFASCMFPWLAQAYPPAPYHVIYGLVRDEYGVPISLNNAQIIFESTNGVQVTGTIVPNLEPGVNYRVILSMDSGTMPDLYKITALKPTVPFRIRVKIGATTFLPIEMVANYANLGKPAQSTRIDLTLGVDANGDGLPDAWQQLLIAMLGPGALTGPNQDADGDGISNLNEYLAGTYAWVPQEGLRLSLVRRSGQGAVIQFFGTAGQTYSVQGTTNLVNWADLSIRVPAGDTNAPTVVDYLNPASQNLETEVVTPVGLAPAMFFRVRVH